MRLFIYVFMALLAYAISLLLLLLLSIDYDCSVDICIQSIPLMGPLSGLSVTIVRSCRQFYREAPDNIYIYIYIYILSVLFKLRRSA